MATPSKDARTRRRSILSNTKRGRALRFLGAAGVGIGLLAADFGSTQASIQTRLAVPAYFWPGDAFNTLTASAAAVRHVVINPASGPGTSAVPTFVSTIASLRAAGIEVSGYVHTTYGDRPVADVKAEIQKYKDFYGITSIFFDETPWQCATTPWYTDIANIVRGNGGKAILNPGMNPESCWATVGDIIVNFEGSVWTYESWAPAAWTSGYPATKFWHIVYSTPIDKVETVVQQASARNAGYLYVTDDVPGNPFDRLPDPRVWKLATDKVLGVAPTTTTTTTTVPPTTAAPTTAAPTTAAPTTAAPTTAAPTTAAPTTAAPTTAAPTTAAPTTAAPTTAAPTTAAPTTAAPTTAAPTTAAPTTAAPTTAAPATTTPKVVTPTTAAPTTAAPTTAAPATTTPKVVAPTTAAPTTSTPRPTTPVVPRFWTSSRFIERETAALQKLIQESANARPSAANSAALKLAQTAQNLRTTTTLKR